MKSYNHLFEKLIDHDNIYNAILRASKHKKDRAEVRKVLANINKYIYRLQDLLINKKLKIRKHNAILIEDGARRKRRLIVKPDFVFEQILHHALVRVLAPIFMKSMYKWSCGSLPKRGGLYGKRYLEKYIKYHPKNIKYVAKGDIKHFFQEVDVDVVKSLLRKRIHDEKFLEVMYLVLDSNIAIYQSQEVYMGLPIGYYLSQWLANWLLSDLDHKIKEQLKIKCYVRYVDDFVLMSGNKKELHKALITIRLILTKLRLKIKGNYQVFKFIYKTKSELEKGRAIDFMGFKFFRNGKTTLRKNILLKATRKALKMKNKLNYNWYEATQLISYIGWFKHTNTYLIYETRIQPLVNIGKCKKIISLHSKRKEKQNVIRLEECRKFGRTA